MAGMADSNTPVAGMPLPAQAARPTLGDVMAAQGSAPGQAAARVGTAISPLFASPATAAPAAPAAAAGMPMPSGQSDAATGGANRQLAAVTAGGGQLPFTPPTADSIGQTVLGSTAMGALGRVAPAFAQGGAQGIGSGLGNLVTGIGLGGLHAAGTALAAPLVAIHDTAGAAADQVARFTGGIAQGIFGQAPSVPRPQLDDSVMGLAGHLFGGRGVTPAAAAPAVAMPAQVAAGPAAQTDPFSVAGPQTEAGARIVMARMAARDAASGVTSPRAGVMGVPDGRGGTTYMATGDGTQPAGGGMPAQVAAPPRQQSALEKSIGAPAGYVQDYLARVPLGQRLNVASQVAGAEQTAQKAALQGQAIAQMQSEYRASQTQNQGESAEAFAARSAAGSQAFRTRAALMLSPQSVQAGLSVNGYNAIPQ